MRTRTIGFLVAIYGLLLGLGIASLLPRVTVTTPPWFMIGLIWLGILGALLTISRVTRDDIGRWLVVGTMTVLAGGLWGIGSRLSLEPGGLPYESSLQVTGVVVSFPEIVGRRQEFVLRTSSFGKPVRLLVTTGREPIVHRGATVEVTGTLAALANTPEFPEATIYEGRRIFGRFSYPDRLVETGPPDRWWTAVGGLRDRMAGAIRSTLPEPAASLALGLALGIDPEIDRVFADDLKRTNLTHLAAVSGQNLTFTVLLIFSLLKRRSLRLAILASLLVLVGYVVLTGAQASIVRAALMTGLLFVGRWLGRPSDGLRLLLVAVAVFALADPLALTHDVGFALSVFALAGIILFSPLVEARLHFLPELARELVSFTTSASLAVLPIQLATFQTVSLVGIPANVLVGLLVPLAMGGSLLIGLAGAAVPTLAPFIIPALYAPLELIHVAATTFGDLAGAQVAISVSASGRVILLGAGVGVLVYLVSRRLLRPWSVVPVRRWP